MQVADVQTLEYRPEEKKPAPEAKILVKKRGRPKKDRDPEALPMTPAPSHADRPRIKDTVELQQIHFHGSVFVGGNQATILTRGKNNVQEMHLVLSSGLVCIVFGASEGNRAATVYLPPSRWAQVTERDR